MRYEAKVVGRIDLPNNKRIVIEHARLIGEDYSGRELVQFCATDSHLEHCRFDNARIEHAQFGGGRKLCELVECSFDGARMEMGPGGITRFVRCSFRNVDLRRWRCFAVELVDCTFSGRLCEAIFNGAVRAEDRPFVGRDRNEFRGNDFSGMDLIDVAFRTGIDLTEQRLPSGAEYTYLVDAALAVSRARARVLKWDDDETRRVALLMLKSWEENLAMGQRQLFLREDDYHGQSSIPGEAVRRVFDLFREDSARQASTRSSD